MRCTAGGSKAAIFSEGLESLSRSNNWNPLRDCADNQHRRNEGIENE